LSAYILEWLNVGRVDCALVYNATSSATVDLLPLLDDQLYLIAPLAASPADGAAALRDGITLSALANYPLIIPSRPHALRMSVEKRNWRAWTGRYASHMRSSAFPPSSISCGRATDSAFLPMNAVKSTQWANEVRALPIGNPPLTTSLSIATSAQRPRSPLMRKAIDVIRDIVRQEILSNQTTSAGPRGTEIT